MFIVSYIHGDEKDGFIRVDMTEYSKSFNLKSCKLTIQGTNPNTKLQNLLDLLLDMLDLKKVLASRYFIMQVFFMDIFKVGN